MSETTNYGLYLTDGNSERFLEWRNRMNGTDNSNMMKIDAALGGKAEKSISIDIVLLASGWTGVDAPFTQVVQIEGAQGRNHGQIGLSPNATAEQREIAREAILFLTEKTDTTITIVADGEMPEFDLPVTLNLYD